MGSYIDVITLRAVGKGWRVMERTLGVCVPSFELVIIGCIFSKDPGWTRLIVIESWTIESKVAEAKSDVGRSLDGKESCCCIEWAAARISSNGAIFSMGCCCV